MTNLKYIVAVLFWFTFVNTSLASVNICIANQTVTDDALYFDVFLSTSEVGEVAYLSHSDIVLSFDAGKFDNPQFAKVGSASNLNFGYCSLTSSVYSEKDGEITKVNVQKPYFDQTQTAIVGNRLVINFNGLVVSNKEDMEERVAMIDNRKNTHRLGRFMITGAGSSNVNLELASSGVLKSNLFGHDQFDENLVVKQLSWGKCNTKKSMVFESEEASDVLVYPNPTADFVQVVMLSNDNNITDYGIYTIAGDLVSQGRLAPGKSGSTLNLEHLSAGVYLLKIDGHKTVHKVIKQ